MYSAAGEKFFIFTGHIQGIYIDFETSKALFGSFSDHACGFLHENRLIFTTTNNAFLKAFTVKSQKNCRLGGDFFCSKSRTETPPWKIPPWNFKSPESEGGWDLVLHFKLDHPYSICESDRRLYRKTQITTIHYSSTIKKIIAIYWNQEE